MNTLQICVILIIAQYQKTNPHQALCQLIKGAFIFVCHSCKYVKVLKPDEKKTKILMLKNIIFIKNGSPKNQIKTNISNNQIVLPLLSICRKMQENKTPSHNGMSEETHGELVCN